MSVKVMSWVWEQSQAVGTERLVLLAIADRASDEGADAWPSVETLCRKTRLSKSTVLRCIARLEDLGELAVSREEGRSNRYHVLMRDYLPEVADPSQDDTAPVPPPAVVPTRDRSHPDTSWSHPETGVKKTPVSPVTREPVSLVTPNTSSTSRSLSPRAREGTDPLPFSRPLRGPRRGLLQPPNPFAGAFPVPQTLHARFVGLLEGRESNAETALWTFYFETVQAWTEGVYAKAPPEPDMFRFWQARFRERWPPAPETTPGRSGRPEPAARAVPDAHATDRLLEELTRRGGR